MLILLKPVANKHHSLLRRTGMKTRACCSDFGNIISISFINSHLVYFYVFSCDISARESSRQISSHGRSDNIPNMSSANAQKRSDVRGRPFACFLSCVRSITFIFLRVAELAELSFHIHEEVASSILTRVTFHLIVYAYASEHSRSVHVAVRTTQ